MLSDITLRNLKTHCVGGRIRVPHGFKRRGACRAYRERRIRKRGGNLYGARVDASPLAIRRAACPTYDGGMPVRTYAG